MKNIKLGIRVKDEVTGFIGIANSKCEYLNGCVQYEVIPPIDEKGDPRKGKWIDEQQLTIVSGDISGWSAWTDVEYLYIQGTNVTGDISDWSALIK